MRLISPREYAAKTKQKFQTVYYQMEKGRLPFVTVEKKVKRIPWDDISQKAVNPE